MNLGNGATGVVTEQWAYNNRLQATQLTAGVWQMKLFYCAGQALTCTSNNGNILRQEGFGGASWDYQYDEYNRLKWAEEKVAGASKWHQQFLFDAFGNRRLLNDAGTLIPNQMMTPRVALVSDPNPFNTANNQWTGAEYYPNGNQKTAWGNGTDVGSAKYFYDGENRMRQADVNWPGSGTITTMEYGYDGEGRRVMRKVGGAVRTVWVYDAMGQMVAEYESGTVAAPSCGGPCYLTADHLGSTRVVWGGDGAIKQLRDYAPFGEEVVSTFRGDDVRYPTVLYPRSGTQSLPVEFTGKERDAETGLDYFGARYMSSAQGRFTSPDWSPTPQPVPFADLSNPQTLNLYSYVANNPLRTTDPNGHCGLDLNCWSEFGSGVADTTYRPIVHAVTNPVQTVKGVANAVAHPVDTAVAVKDAVVETTNAALSGDSKAVGKVVGTIVSAVVTAGAAKAVTSLAKGTATTNLYRAVGTAEADSIGAARAFTAAPNGTEFKGFFFAEADAQSFGSRMTQMTGDTHSVVGGVAPTKLVNSSAPHVAATEGRGVLIRNQDLPKVRVR